MIFSPKATPLFTTPSSFKSNGTCPLEALHPGAGHAGLQQQYRYSATLSLTSALHGGEWPTPCPGHFTPGNGTWYPLYRMLGGPQGVWTAKVNLAPQWAMIPGSSSL